jgi:hydroxyacyl-ACP dehydratase HTD2-like protein with hotdog domain
VKVPVRAFLHFSLLAARIGTGTSNFAVIPGTHYLSFEKGYDSEKGQTKFHVSKQYLAAVAFTNRLWGNGP